MISMMMSALSLPAAGTATTISVVLNVTKNKEVESGLITRETRRLENLQRPSRWFGVGEKASMRNGGPTVKIFLQEIRSPLVSIF